MPSRSRPPYARANTSTPSCAVAAVSVRGVGVGVENSSCDSDAANKFHGSFARRRTRNAERVTDRDARFGVRRLQRAI